MNGEVMKRSLLSIATALLFTATAWGQERKLDLNNLTPEQIEEFKAKRHAFYAEENRGQQEAIREYLLGAATKVDGNQADFDVRYYGINVSLNFTNGTIVSRVDYKIKSLISGLNAVDLNLHSQLIVDSVRVNGVAASFSRPGDLLSITTPSSVPLNQEFDMKVYYHGTPYYSFQQGMEFALVWGYDMCWTNCEPFGSRHWWPCKDHPEDKPESLDIYIERPFNYDVASNGKIMSDTDLGGGRKRVHYKHNYPIATYLVAISCADFDLPLQTNTWNYDSYSMPVYSFTLPNASDSRSSYTSNMLPVLTNLSDAFGTYPFADEKAGNANYGWGGAMEHQTCSFYNPGFYDDWVIAHETGHQWWGDMITCRTFNHIWLNEGFASYAEPLYFERLYGESFYHVYMSFQEYLGSGTVYVENILTDNIFDGNLVYDKGSWVLHMLRGVVGDSAFFKAIRDYHYSPFQYGTANTEDLSAIVSSSVGTDMSWFFNQWIYGNGSPAYQISWTCPRDTVNGGFDLTYFIAQTQGGTYFRMPVRTTFVTTGPDLDTIIWNENPTQVIQIDFADSVTNIIFDPEKWILRSLQVVPFTLHIITVTLPAGEQDDPYFVQLEALGGVPPYTWTKLGGDIPLGLTFQGGTVGEISGTPTWPSTYYFTLQVNDSSIPPLTETHAYALTINPPGPEVGDADGSGIINVADAVFLIQYIFAGGPAPIPLSLGDCNCSGIVNVADVVFLVQYIFGSGPAPTCP